MLKGNTLIGLMLSIALGAGLLLSAAQFYAHSQTQHQEMMQRLTLQAEMQRIIQLMGKDLRRAGFRAVNEKLLSSNLSLFELDEKGRSIAISQADNASPNSCVLFFYDLNSNGCIGEKYTSNHCLKSDRNVAKNIEKELFGYKLNGKMIETKQTYKSAVNASCDLAECRQYLSQPACNVGGGWTDLFDEKEFEVTKLDFHWLIEHKAIEIKLVAHSAQNKTIEYETSLIVPLLNQE